MAFTVMEPLRDRIGRVLYEEPGLERDWDTLSEERREPWRRDADRIIIMLERDDAELRATTAERDSISHCETKPPVIIWAYDGETPYFYTSDEEIPVAASKYIRSVKAETALTGAREIIEGLFRIAPSPHPGSIGEHDIMCQLRRAREWLNANDC